MAAAFLNAPFVSLGTYTFLIPAAGNWSLDGKLSIPSLAAGDSADSQVVVTINQNGSPIYVGPAGAKGFRAVFQAAASDAMAVVLSSAAAIDQPANSVKGTGQLAQLF